jgi:uncharacterized tellurite resistance protein B-like protein
MRDAASLIFALLAVGGVILVLMYLRYRHSPAVLWRDRVRRRRAEVQAQRGSKKDRGWEAAVDDTLAKLDRLADIAKDVSFWNSLFHQKVPGLTDEVLHAELPGLPRGGDERAPGPPLVSASRQTKTSPPPPPPPAEPTFLPRLRTVARFGILVAKADGRVAKAEKGVLREHLGKLFASDAVALRFIDPELEAAHKATLDEADVIAAVKDLPPDERRELLALAHRIASAAGQVGAKEQQLLARLTAALGEPPPPPPADPRHNPDLDAAFGAPPEAPPPVPPPTDLRQNPDLDAVFGV